MAYTDTYTVDFFSGCKLPDASNIRKSGVFPDVQYKSDADIQRIVANVKGPMVHNNVINAQWENPPDVAALAWMLRGKYNSKAFAPSCKVKLKEPKCSITIYPAGKLVVNGTPDVNMGIMALFNLQAYLGKMLGYTTIQRNIRIQNMQATIYMNPGSTRDVRIDMDKLHRDVPTSSYTPQAIKQLRIPYESAIAQPDGKKPHIMFNVWATGNIVLCGCNSAAVLIAAFQEGVRFFAHYVIED
jgi:TATA-box binding protein (TBP) (component of TFIID and TFIIIB)